jgi:hypothetical protein
MRAQQSQQTGGWRSDNRGAHRRWPTASFEHNVVVGLSHQVLRGGLELLQCLWRPCAWRQHVRLQPRDGTVARSAAQRSRCARATCVAHAATDAVAVAVDNVVTGERALAR